MRLATLVRRWALGVAARGRCGCAPPRPAGAGGAVETVPGMPPVADPANLYSETPAGQAEPGGGGRAAARLRAEPASRNDVYVIDPATLKVVDRFTVGINPQHVVPSWDLKTLWVTNNAEGRHRRQPDADRSHDRQAGQARRRRRPVQHVLHAGRQLGDRRRRGAQAARLPRPADDGAAVLARGAAVRGHQPRRLLHRRPLSPSSPASSRAACAKVDMVDRKVLGYLKLSRGGHAPGHPRLARRQGLLRRRHEGGRRLRGRRRAFTEIGVHPDRDRHARPLSEPRRHQALRGQPRHLARSTGRPRARAASR